MQGWNFHNLIFLHSCVDAACFHYTFFSVDNVHLGCFHNLDVVNIAAMNMDRQVSLEENVKSFGYILKSGIAISYVRSVFSLLRNLYTDFHMVCTIFLSYEQ